MNGKENFDPIKYKSKSISITMFISINHKSGLSWCWLTKDFCLEYEPFDIWCVLSGTGSSFQKIWFVFMFLQIINTFDYLHKKREKKHCKWWTGTTWFKMASFVSKSRDDKIWISFWRENPFNSKFIHVNNAGPQKWPFTMSKRQKKMAPVKEKYCSKNSKKEKKIKIKVE